MYILNLSCFTETVEVASVIVDQMSASWSYDQDSIVLSNVSFEVNKVRLKWCVCTCTYQNLLSKYDILIEMYMYL